MLDYKRHNEQVKEVWDSYNKGTPIRVPMIIGVNPRYILLDPKYNKKGITFRDYFEDPEVMFHVQLMFRDFVMHHIVADHEMGIPENGWKIVVDFQNNFESAWLGAEIVYQDGNCPVCEPFLDDDHKNLLFERGLPDAFSGLMGKAREYTELFNEKRQKKFTYKGAPLAPVYPAILSTDGPFTLACNIRGTDQFCIDLYEDPEYAHQLLDYITQATIQRLKAWRRYFNQSERQAGFSFADDSIALLSPEMYRDWILPYHRQLVEELSTSEAENSIHLCGNASHQFPALLKELNVTSFDTGFPIDHRNVLQGLGRDVTMFGGPTVDILLRGTTQDVVEETKRILLSVKDITKKFVLRDANNLPPLTPLENIQAMYDTVNTYGVYDYK